MSSSVHISLNVTNLDRSVDFYRHFFGEPKKLKADYAKFVPSEPELHLALQPGPVRGPGAVSHFGIRVDSIEKVQLWKKALDARGLPTTEKNREACCYALQEKFWVADPDGNRWEVYTVLEDIEKKADSQMTCCQPQGEAAGPGTDEKGRSAAACC